jgi:hypothetical protein
MGRKSSIERDTVLVLGAGASLGARVERAAFERTPPLGKDLAGYLLGWLEQNDARDPERRRQAALEYDEGRPSSRLWDDHEAIDGLLRRARDWGSDDGFERVMSELAGRPEIGLLATLNAVIAVSFLGGDACGFDEGPDGYDALVSAVGPRLRAVITPNYDLLLEEALARPAMPSRYAGTLDAPAPVVVFKIHGSANFFLPNGGGRGVTIEIAQRNAKPTRGADQAPFFSSYNDHNLYAAPDRANARIEHKRREMMPVLVTYGPQKPAVHARPHLDKLREECFREMTESPPTRIIATGIRPPVDDDLDDPTWSNLCALFARLPSKKEYWSGKEDERRSMARFGFDGHDGWFKDLVEGLESEKD